MRLGQSFVFVCGLGHHREFLNTSHHSRKALIFGPNDLLILGPADHSHGRDKFIKSHQICQGKCVSYKHVKHAIVVKKDMSFYILLKIMSD